MSSPSTAVRVGQELEVAAGPAADVEQGARAWHRLGDQGVDLRGRARVVPALVHQVVEAGGAA